MEQQVKFDRSKMKTEVQYKADFSSIRYAMCWEDADILVEALAPENRRCLSIGSAGDNSFSLLAAGATEVVCVEMNPAQVACIELRKSAYLSLDHQEFLQLLGAVPCSESARKAFYQRCASGLSVEAREFWERHPNQWRTGMMHLGKFENYFRMFREYVLPLAHRKNRVCQLLESRSAEQRLQFYENEWNTNRWRWIFHVFFSRFTMGRLGRDPAFFAYVEGSVAERILRRVRHALVELDPSRNPYLHMILRGSLDEDLPHAWRKQHFDTIRKALQDDRLKIVSSSLEKHFAEHSLDRYDAMNLSDIFEYMSEETSHMLLRKIVQQSNVGARLAYWNMLAPRSRPESMSDVLFPLASLADELFQKDQAFFYSRFVVEEVRG